MVKARYIESKGLINEPGSGLSIEDSTTFTSTLALSGTVNFDGPLTASAGMVVRTDQSGSGTPFALTITASEGSSADTNAILLYSTGSSQGSNIGIGMAVPTGGAALFFDPHFREVGAGSDRPSLKYKVGSTIYVISASTA